MIPAIELDCTFQGHDFHLLGYGINPEAKEYAEIEKDIITQEQQASAQRLALLREHLHIYIDEEELKRRSFHGIYVAETICEIAMEDARNKEDVYKRQIYEFPEGKKPYGEKIVLTSSYLLLCSTKITVIPRDKIYWTCAQVGYKGCLLYTSSFFSFCTLPFTLRNTCCSSKRVTLLSVISIANG